MLLRFRAANVRSLRDEQELSFVVSEPDASLSGRRQHLGGESFADVLPLIGIFGANASGKSNVLAAMTDMRTAVLNSYAQWASYSGIPRRPFALDPKGERDPSFFEVDLVLDEVRWTYGFELSSTRVTAEWIHSYPRGHRQVWLDRDDSRATVYEWPGNRVRDRAQLAKRTRPNALVLSTAGTDNHPQLSPLFHWFRRNLWLINPEDEREYRETFTQRELSGARAHRIEELLRVADLGITGMELGEDGTVKLTHQTASGEVALDWRDESFGTRSWFALLGPTLLALDEGAVLLIDELDASLHPRFAAEVIRLFHDRQSNPRNAQLVFTSHDSSLLATPSGERLLEPNQIWLTEKNKDGATELYPLTAAEPGAQENLMTSYLAGAFGGVPFLVEGEIARRLVTTTERRSGRDT